MEYEATNDIDRTMKHGEVNKIPVETISKAQGKTKQNHITLIYWDIS